MRIQLKLGAALATFVLGLAPALAIAAHPNNGKHGSQSNSQGHAKAFGKLCSAESKKHVAGQKGTPFSQCVAAMKKAASGKANSPGQACKGLSKKHVAGMKAHPLQPVRRCGRPPTGEQRRRRDKHPCAHHHGVTVASRGGRAGPLRPATQPRRQRPSRQPG